jgi:hypothetical protein
MVVERALAHRGIFARNFPAPDESYVIEGELWRQTTKSRMLATQRMALQMVIQRALNRKPGRRLRGRSRATSRWRLTEQRTSAHGRA